MQLFLKPTDMGSGPLPNDWAVLDEDKKHIGRIYLSKGAPADAPQWFWGNLRIPNIPGRDRGHAGSFEEAKAAFKASWESGL